MTKYYKMRDALYEVVNNKFVYFLDKGHKPLRIISIYELNELLNNPATKEITKKEIQKKLSEL